VLGARVRLIVALLAAALMVPALDTAAVAATAAEKYANSAFRATNAQRIERDLTKLDRHKCLRRMAVAHAKRMANREEISHQDLTKVLGRCNMQSVGENVAAGYKTGKAAVNKGWMNSPLHKLNIVNPAWRRMGIGARKGEDGRWYVSQLFGHKA
jgi:uncharacterized protein YkwD